MVFYKEVIKHITISDVRYLQVYLCQVSNWRADGCVQKCYVGF
jgi:hypothetical protein